MLIMIGHSIDLFIGLKSLLVTGFLCFGGIFPEGYAWIRQPRPNCAQLRSASIKITPPCEISTVTLKPLNFTSWLSTVIIRRGCRIQMPPFLNHHIMNPWKNLNVQFVTVNRLDVTTLFLEPATLSC